MPNSTYDVIVAGAGPSGSACAALFSSKGLRVLLLDKARFPRDKPCGDAIGGKALNVLSELGLEADLSKKGFQRSSGIVFSSPNASEVEVPLSNNGTKMSGGYVCKRLDFDNMVYEKAKESCDVLEEIEVIGIIFEGTRAVGVKTRANDGEEREFHGKLLVGADGATSVVARKVGAYSLNPKHLCSAVRGYYSGVNGLRGNVEIHFLPECMPGYFWIFPLSDNEANVGVGMLVSDISRMRIHLNRTLEACMKNPRFKGRFDAAKLEGNVKGWSLPLASARRKCAGNGWILVGDAASLIDPFSGEGIGNGMKSAKIAADALWEALKSGGVNEADCLSYERSLWKEIGPDVNTSYTIQKLGRNGWLLDMIIGKAKRSDWLKNELAGMIANREAKRKVADPVFYLRVLLS